MNKIYDVVDEYKDLILEAERYIWKNPEPGYKEFKTNKYMAQAFEKLGYKLTYADGITGFYTTIDTGKKGPTVLVLAELDSLINFSHPECDKETGAVHSCGHNAQCAALLGLAAALKHKECLEGLCGKIKLCCVPAEEGIEIGYRKELVKKGVIRFTSGKAEFISRRYFDDVDVAFMMHTSAPDEKCGDKKFKLTRGHNGVIRKQTTYVGKASHAGSRPHEGINALNAANLGLLAVNSLRETFKEEDYVRVHSIITKGGDAVNAVPDEVMIESYVRAATSASMKKANEAVNRALSAAAVAIGAGLHISDLAGSEPLNEDKNLRQAAFEVFEEIAGKDCYRYVEDWGASSTDMGDVGSLFPSIHMYTMGSVGTMHGKDYRIVDPYSACVLGAKAELGIIRKLLLGGGARAKKIKSEFTPVFTSVDEYLEHKSSIDIEQDAVIYNQDGTITVKYKR